MSNTNKAEAFARVITGKAVTVVAGKKTQGPGTDGRKIVLGCAMDWDIEDRFGVLFHECCHIMFPAKYPEGNLRECANMIDDCRIERQAIADRPHYADALTCVCTNVIANDCYGTPPRDRFTEEDFDPSLWSLLFFRPHVGEEVRLAASECIKSYAVRKDLVNRVEKWDEKFDKLISEGQRITRLRSVSKQTLAEWCGLYFEVFPDATKDLNGSLPIPVYNDNPSPKKENQEDSQGSGDAKSDSQIRSKVTGKSSENGQGKPEDKEDGDEKDGNEGKDDKDSKKDSPENPFKNDSKAKGDQGDAGEAPDVPDLESALERLVKAVGKVGDKSKKRSQAAGEGQNQIGEIESVDVPNEVPELPGSNPGSEVGVIGSVKTNHTVDKSFTIRTKMAVRKIRAIGIDRIERFHHSGRIHMPTIIRAEQQGILPRRPFLRATDDLIDVPVACVVATDFSGSTEGSANPHLNAFSHNALYALQEAGCECAEVVWNSGSWITKTLDQRVSALETYFHRSCGGTDLVAAAKGCVKALLHSKAQRKVAFVFTDGGVNHSEVTVIDEYFRRNGFEACLLVSLGEAVPHKGIVDSEVCTSLSDLGGIFEKFARRQTIKTVSVV